MGQDVGCRARWCFFEFYVLEWLSRSTVRKCCGQRLVFKSLVSFSLLDCKHDLSGMKVGGKALVHRNWRFRPAFIAWRPSYWGWASQSVTSCNQTLLSSLVLYITKGRKYLFSRFSWPNLFSSASVNHFFLAKTFPINLVSHFSLFGLCPLVHFILWTDCWVFKAVLRSANWGSNGARPHWGCGRLTASALGSRGTLPNFNVSVYQVAS